MPGQARNKANPIFGQYGKAGTPLYSQYRTRVKRLERMCRNRLAEIAVTEKGLLGSAAPETPPDTGGSKPSPRRPAIRSLRLIGPMAGIQATSRISRRLPSMSGIAE